MELILLVLSGVMFALSVVLVRMANATMRDARALFSACEERQAAMDSVSQSQSEYSATLRQLHAAERARAASMDRYADALAKAYPDITPPMREEPSK